MSVRTIYLRFMLYLFLCKSFTQSTNIKLMHTKKKQQHMFRLKVDLKNIKNYLCDN